MQINLSLRLSHTARRPYCVRRPCAGFFWCYPPSCRVVLRGTHGQGYLPWAQLVLGKDVSTGLGQLSTPKMSKTWKAERSLVISYLLLSYFKGSLLPLSPRSDQYFPFGTQCQSTLSQEVLGYGGIRPDNDQGVRISFREESLTMAVYSRMRPGVFRSHILLQFCLWVSSKKAKCFQ